MKHTHIQLYILNVQQKNVYVADIWIQAPFAFVDVLPKPLQWFQQQNHVYFWSSATYTRRRFNAFGYIFGDFMNVLHLNNVQQMTNSPTFLYWDTLCFLYLLNYYPMQSSKD